MSHSSSRPLGTGHHRWVSALVSVTLVGAAAVATAPAASAIPPVGLAAACVFTDPNDITVEVNGADTGLSLLTGLPITGNLATVQLSDAGTGALLGTAVSASVLNGQVSIPPISVPVGVGSQVSSAGVNFSIVPTISGLFTPIVGNSPCAALPTAPVFGAYINVGPTRVLGTPTGTGTTVPPGGSVAVQVAGANGVPATGVSAVNLVVTATKATGDGHITAYPSGTALTNTSNLNYVAGQDVANTVLAVPGADGKTMLYNGSTGSVQLLADVAGYYVSGTLPLLPGGFKAVTPSRILDTRIGGGKLAAQQNLAFQVAGQGGLPDASQIGSVVVNLTVTNPTSEGHLRLFPDQTPLPNVSNINFDKGRTVADLAVVGVGSDGKINIFEGGAIGNVDVIVDVVGYIQSGLVPVQVPGLQNVVNPPVRLLDTRTGTGTTGIGKVPSTGSVVLQVNGIGGVPSSNIRAVVLTVTTTNETAPGHITVYPSGIGRPPTSILNYKVHSDIANLVIVPVGADGKIVLFNGSTGPTDLVTDVAGYITGDTVSA